MTEIDWLGNDNQLGIDIWRNKYRWNNETFDEWLDRISDKNIKVRKLILEKKFLFGGRILANINTGTKQGISNCVTMGFVEDSLEEIMNVAKDLAMSYKREAGVGIALSKIRPKGARIGEKGKSDGIIGFLKIFNEVTANISRGNQRRGAMLCGLHCDHPDILDFINIKKNNKELKQQITSANLSVLITDEFMENYKNGKTYRKDFIVKSTGEIIEHYVDTVKIMNTIADTPFTSFEPGILFVDRYREGHLFGYAKGYEEMFNNACSEFIGKNGTVCLLGSINLSEFVKNKEFDFKDFEYSVNIAVEALDNAHNYGIGRNGLEIQNKLAEEHRGIGLGITGLADMFIKMGIKYGSMKSLDLSDKIAKLMKETSILSSQVLGKSLGQPIGILNDEKYLSENNLECIKGLRNSSLLSIAPTGSLSSMLNISSGIEPVFRLSYKRKTESLHEGTVYYDVYHKSVIDTIDTLGYKPEFCVDTEDITAKEKIDMIAIWQKYVDLSISNTTNFKKDIKIEDIRNSYIYGWEKKVKGLTVYVDGSIEGVLSDDNSSIKLKETVKELPRGFIEDVSHQLIGRKRKLVTGCGSLHCSVFFDSYDGKPKEIYLSKGSDGGCVSNLTSLSRMISLSFRAGVEIESVVDQLNSALTCPAYTVRRVTKKDTSRGDCCSTAIGYAILDMYNEVREELGLTNENFNELKEELINKDTKLSTSIHEDKYLCPECGSVLINEGGCVSCKECGYSKCG